MPAETIHARFCADYWGMFHVQSESDPNIKYTVTMDGSEGVPHCTCPAFEYSRDRSCKHIGFVWEEGCFWNPQWRDGGPRTKEPINYCRMPDADCEPCPACGGPTIGVLIAV